MEKYDCTVGLLCYVFEFSCLSFAKLITHTYICFVKMKPAKQDINREYSLTRGMQAPHPSRRTSSRGLQECSAFGCVTLSIITTSRKFPEENN